MNNIHKYLEFKLTEEKNKNITYLYLYIHRNNSNLRTSIGIHRKPHRQTLLYISHPTIH